MARINSRARCWCALAVVSSSKVGASAPALGVRQVLRTRVAICVIRVAKLCAGCSSSINFDAALRCAEADAAYGAGVAKALGIAPGELGQ